MTSARARATVTTDALNTADIVLVVRCPNANELPHSLLTFVGGKIVYAAPPFK
jgi:hypothetical protein